MFAIANIKLWAAIGTAAVIVALLIGLLATRATLSETKRDRDVTFAKLSVSNASVGRLQAELDRMVSESMLLANADANRITASRQVVQLADAAAKVREAAIERLNESAARIRPAVETCAVSTTVDEIWPN